MIIIFIQMRIIYDGVIFEAFEEKSWLELNMIMSLIARL